MDRGELEALVWRTLGNVPGWNDYHARHPAQGNLAVEIILKGAYDYAVTEAELAIRSDNHQRATAHRRRAVDRELAARRKEAAR